MRPLALIACLSIASFVPAQTIDTVGGTNSTPTNANISKANLFRGDSTRLLFTFEGPGCRRRRACSATRSA